MSRQGAAESGGVPGRPLLYRVARVGVLVLLVPAAALAIRYLIREREALEQLLQVDPRLLVGMCLGTAIGIVFNGLVTRDLLRRFGVVLRIREWLGITIIKSMLNLGLPGRGGAVAKGLYLRRAHGLRLTDFVSTLAAATAFILAANAALGALALLALGVPGGIYGQLALATCLGVVVTLLMLLVLGPWLRSRLQKAPAFVVRLLDGWQIISEDSVLLLQLACWTLGHAVVHAVVFVLAFEAVGSSVSIWVPVTSAAFAKLGGAIALTPGGLGIYEAFGMVSAHLVGSGLAASLLALLLVRTIAVLFVVVGGAVMWPVLWSAPGSQTNTRHPEDR